MTIATTVERIYRIDYDGSSRYVVEREGSVRLVDGDIFGAYTLSKEIANSGIGAATRLLAPVVPSKIVAVGLNYKDHAAEQNKPLPSEPLIFLKPSTSVIGPGAAIRIPPGIGRVDHEAEVGVVIGKRAHRVPRERAHEYILGLTCVNDVTARDLQNRDSQYTRCKGFDSFGPIGPCIATGLNGVIDDLDVEGWVNGEQRQRSNTRELIFSIPDLLAWISFVMTLLPGDIISTGTPAGIGPIRAGDRVTVKVQQVGELTNTVEAE